MLILAVPTPILAINDAILSLNFVYSCQVVALRREYN